MPQSYPRAGIAARAGPAAGILTRRRFGDIIGRPVVLFTYLVCVLVWSTTWFAIRVCIRPGGYPTYSAIAIRFTIAAVILLGLLVAGLGRPLPRTRRQLISLALAGVATAAGYAMVYRAETALPGGMVAVLFGTYPLFTALGAALTSTERIRPVDVGAALLSLAGMAILFWDRLAVSAGQAVGVAFAVGAVLATVVYNLILKREAGEVSPLAGTTVFLGVAAAALWALSAARGLDPVPWPPPLAPTLALLYLALCGSVLAFGCYFYLIKHVSLMTASTQVLIQPILALVVDALFEHEVRLEPRSYLGIAVILLGVALGVVWKRWATRRDAASAAAGRPAR